MAISRATDPYHHVFLPVVRYKQFNLRSYTAASCLLSVVLPATPTVRFSLYRNKIVRFANRVVAEKAVFYNIIPLCQW